MSYTATIASVTTSFRVQGLTCQLAEIFSTTLIHITALQTKNEYIKQVTQINAKRICLQPAFLTAYKTNGKSSKGCLQA